MIRLLDLATLAAFISIAVALPSHNHIRLAGTRGAHLHNILIMV
jgi:hypothetical protein